MHALITNDDGIDSTGLHRLARAAVRAGMEAVVAAPSWDSSGASASLTAVEEGGRVLVRPQEVPGLAGTAVAVEAAPAFIARAAVHGAFGPVPDVVLSGVNRGPNTGHAVLHSGTVGAASTASLAGVPGLAFSVDGGEDAHWDTVDHVVDEVLGWFVAERPSLLLNVNVPDVPLDGLRGLRHAPLAARGAVSTTITEVGRGYVTIEEAEPGPAEPGTDAALIDEGWATVTALAPTCEAPGADLGALVASAGTVHGS